MADDDTPSTDDADFQEKLEAFLRECKLRSASNDDQAAGALRDRYLKLTPSQRTTFRQAIQALLLARECIGRLSPGFFYTSLHMRLGRFDGPSRHELLIYEPLLENLDAWDAEARALN